MQGEGDPRIRSHKERGSEYACQGSPSRSQQAASEVHILWSVGCGGVGKMVWPAKRARLQWPLIHFIATEYLQLPTCLLSKLGSGKLAWIVLIYLKSK